MPPFRRPLRPAIKLLVATTLLAATASDAHAATEYFASPDETRLEQDCLTRAKACALGVAVTKPTSASDTVTVLPGAYDLADINAGAEPGSEPNQLQLVAGTILSGDLDAAAPSIASAAPGAAPTIVLTRNTLRYLKVDRQGADGSAVAGVGRPDAPAFLDRVLVTSSAAFGVQLVGTAALRNVLVNHSGVTGAAIRLDASARPLVPDSRPRLLAVTATSTADALRIETDGNEPQEATVTGSVLAGPTRLSATAATGTPGTLTLRGDRSAYLAGSLVVSGPVAQLQTGSVVYTDGMLASDGYPADGSPLIDAGTAVPGLGDVDLAGKSRAVGAAPDIGALERQERPRPTPVPISSDPAAGNADPFGALTPEPDTLEPWLEVSTKVSKLSRRKLSKGYTIKVTTDEPATAKLELVTTTKRKGKITERVLGSTSATAPAAGQLRLKLKISSKRLPKAGSKATLRFTLTDLAGNVSRKSSPTKFS